MIGFSEVSMIAKVSLMVGLLDCWAEQNKAARTCEFKRTLKCTKDDGQVARHLRNVFKRGLWCIEDEGLTARYL